MALYTIPFHHNFMAALRILGRDSFMALAADLVRIFIQQLPVRSCMRVVTF
jgi:hypothetical protein